VPHVRMSSLSDTLTIGVVLVLLFGSIALYLYTRIQQAEQKVSLLESILLDVKMSAEITSYRDLPADPQEPARPTSSIPPSSDAVSHEEYTMLDDVEKDTAAPALEESAEGEDSVYLRMDDTEEGHTEELTGDELPVEELSSESSDSLLIHAAPLEKEEVAYENMTLKDLQSLAKSRHISGVSTMKKGDLVKALKSSQSLAVEEIFA